MYDKFWLHDYTILLKYWHEFYPTDTMSASEKLNAVTRFFLYSCISLAIVRKDTGMFQYALVGLVVIAIAYKSFPPRQDGVVNPLPEHLRAHHLQPDHLQGGQLRKKPTCVGPTPENPFMNRLVGDTSNPNVPSCSHNDSDVAQESDHLWRRGLYQNVDDVYNTHLSSRQFYTNADNRLPNDQTAFAKSLYSQS
jgi:hypothetical protein